eukprot:TRINITY_DN29198_c0_g2_i1.p1 TRINITY_DN29198_c0_g2~~TRINITY_DN29198_c0_g2_i1.p1  ORF type:complete len:333 (-),score=63.86 TRINITY_DN29198_c0_g2_i1:7-903(-)
MFSCGFVCRPARLAGDTVRIDAAGVEEVPTTTSPMDQSQDISDRIAQAWEEEELRRCQLDEERRRAREEVARQLAEEASEDALRWSARENGACLSLGLAGLGAFVAGTGASSGDPRGLRRLDFGIFPIVEESEDPQDLQLSCSGSAESAELALEERCRAEPNGSCTLSSSSSSAEVAGAPAARRRSATGSATAAVAAWMRALARSRARRRLPAASTTIDATTGGATPDGGAGSPGASSGSAEAKDASGAAAGAAVGAAATADVSGAGAVSAVGAAGCGASPRRRYHRALLKIAGLAGA